MHHSLSPVLHRAAYAALGLSDWTYEAIDCGEAQLPDVLAARSDWIGFSCTMPLKRAAIELAAEVRPVARAVGAANTLLPRGTQVRGGWVADNTDVAGIVASLAEHPIAPQTATILGAGGTAQAAVAALAATGTSRVTVLARDVTRTSDVRATAELLDVDLAVCELGEPNALTADLVISTLPKGAADPLISHPWLPAQTVLDVVYDAWPSPLASAAGAAGARVISGALMLLHQAAAQVQLMTGLEPPVAAMRAALAEAIPAAGLSTAPPASRAPQEN